MGRYLRRLDGIWPPGSGRSPGDDGDALRDWHRGTQALHLHERPDPDAGRADARASQHEKRDPPGLGGPTGRDVRVRRRGISHAAGDLVVSPTWTFHDHYNGGDTPAIWVDGYDNGYATLGEAGKALNERYPADAPYQDIVRPDEYGLRTMGHVRPWSEEAVYPLPPMRYPWAEVQASLQALREAEVEGDPYDGLHLLYTNPIDGGATCPPWPGTSSC